MCEWAEQKGGPFEVDSPVDGWCLGDGQDDHNTRPAEEGVLGTEGTRDKAKENDRTECRTRQKAWAGGGRMEPASELLLGPRTGQLSQCCSGPPDTCRAALGTRH